MAINLVNDNISAIEIQDKKYNIKSIPFHGTAAEWKNNSYIPKDGEIIIYDADENYNYKRIKIGNNINNVDALPFIEEAILNIANTYTDTKITNSINSAPETLDTLGELAAAFKNNSDIIEVLNEAIVNKVDKEDLRTDKIYHSNEILLSQLINDYLLNIDYDNILAFDTTEIIINANKTTSILGQAILGSMILG
jgi:hypothetical protein